jgi:hypothetical protein
MKKLTILLCVLAISCNQKKWKYKITGKTEKTWHTRGGASGNWAIWYTDTFYVKNDTIRIPNSDGSEYTIPVDSSEILVSK